MQIAQQRADIESLAAEVDNLSYSDTPAAIAEMDELIARMETKLMRITVSDCWPALLLLQPLVGSCKDTLRCALLS